jgi:hypothetical protein
MMFGKIKMCFILSVLGTLMVCQSKGQEIDPKILNVFSDYTFVGSGQAKYKDDGSLELTSVIPHNESEQPRPQKLEKGVQYVFHHLAPLDNEELALRELPQKLSQLGFKITKSPKGSQDLIYLVLGGPIFIIKFSDGNHEGIIYNQLETKLDDVWSEHDYVLIYTS